MDGSKQLGDRDGVEESPAKESPAKEELSATLTYPVQPGTEEASLFHEAPPQTWFSVVRSGDAWARLPHEGYKGARIFVDH